jgi:hypothetical protein
MQFVHFLNDFLPNRGFIIPIKSNFRSLFLKSESTIKSGKGFWDPFQNGLSSLRKFYMFPIFLNIIGVIYFGFPKDVRVAPDKLVLN